MSEPVEDFLQHYGVKGMRWGKRKASSDVEVSKKSKGPIDKDRLSEERAKLYGGVKKRYEGRGQKVLAGAAIASSVITGGTTGSVVVGAQMMRGAGFSKGKSVATALIGGAPGAVLMIELQARKNARD
ncbi:hypothetical protein SEA_SLOOPYJOE_9 [Arthrobacter phage Sloopyjoe]|nr:hypothetical protein PBI_STAYER_9 [Arthrobacter phage Stayer]QFG09718.1 hypothetical protein PBI_SHIBA_9 [Arthrobacter phage Shiba]QFG10153.1 hypothetical protein PBI_EGAD_9 [Arthrobacter phage Egad]QFG11723.1 hypothetical protein PBI_SALK_9 [Arthrobacter phage Salk]QFG12606.1 hypothetical protein PBI_MICHELLE_9 [Arthrobacter phage Michelle]QFG14379.1 hypothetical protein PBI_STARLORD_9 [Arthrobacter phage StarLord]UVT31087.1 hypothetical protein PBI_LINDA_9 [Arthrobacter phage Linda]WAB0